MIRDPVSHTLCLCLRAAGCALRGVHPVWGEPHVVRKLDGPGELAFQLSSTKHYTFLECHAERVSARTQVQMHTSEFKYPHRFIVHHRS